MAETVGSLFIRPGKKDHQNWRLMRTTYVNGKRQQKSVPESAWTALGFSDSMSLEQARSRASQLNAENSVKRTENLKIAGIATRLERDRLHHSAFLPQDLNDQFLKWLEENTSGSPKHVEKLKIIWGTVKKAIIGLQLSPDAFEGNKKKIYRYLSNTECSPDYARKQITIMNQYGRFTARLTGKWYEPIPPPRGQDREMIADAYYDGDGFVGASESMDLDTLNLLRERLEPKQFNWVDATTWLGLRPIEMDAVLEDRDRKTWRVEEGEVDVLWVYQSKLLSKPRNERWKPIPILYPEQKRALEIILTGNAEAPVTKTLKAKTGRNHTKYTGRKGFCDIMLDRGQTLEHISQWMGHANPQRTITNYKNKNVVRFTKVET